LKWIHYIEVIKLIHYTYLYDKFTFERIQYLHISIKNYKLLTNSVLIQLIINILKFINSKLQNIIHFNRKYIVIEIRIRG